MKGAPYHGTSGPYGAGQIAMKHGEGRGIPDPPALMAPGKTAAVSSPARAAGGRALVRAAGLMIVATRPHVSVLFIKRSGVGDHGGEWCFPGGHIDPGETPAQAALRETHEEVGFPAGGHPALWTRRVADGVDFATFIVKTPQPFRPRLNGEHTDAVWASPSHPPMPLHPGCLVALDKLRGMVGDKEGGQTGSADKTELVPIIAAGGEYILRPHECRWLGKGDLEKGHRALDQFVIETRGHLRKTLGKLKPPKRD
ncbi:NUDIX domain-containing protein [Acidisoma cellulosilytica]|uniref:NUDIX domain-containing protein n=2 Tax=Acidisoma cellulosilyticum TaxID=2802395 RepID=A0A963Z084_9PROT|nr:NUDIX domain-containing protein [Acidisoma cellulosilyticum]